MDRILVHRQMTRTDINYKPGSRSQSVHYKPGVGLNTSNARVQKQTQKSGRPVTAL